MAGRAPSDWSSRALFELAEYQNGMAFRPADTKGNGLPIIKIAELNGGIGPSTGRARGEVDPRKVIRPGDLLFAWSGSVGVYKWTGPQAVLNQHIFKVSSKDGVDQPFLRYLLESQLPTFQRVVDDQATTMGHVKVSDLKRLKVLVPPLPEQRAIASILGSLDDKIELNRRMNQTLEEIARALFKFWFVDFGPVRAKAEGRWKKGESLPGMPADMWDLWPSGFEESEIGEIPKGWRLVRLAERCSTQYGFTASATDEAIGPRFLRVTDINKFPWIDWQSVPYCSISETERPKYTLSEGDILVARMADPGKCAIVEGSENAVFASYLVRLRVDSLARAYYTFYFLRADEYQEYAEGARSGSVQANMNARVLVDVLHLDPPTWVLNAFLDSILPLRRKLALDLAENATLSQLRDALLPKLLSGEIRVPVNGGR
jgi:type I restriction enzyme S subunit